MREGSWQYPGQHRRKMGSQKKSVYKGGLDREKRKRKKNHCNTAAENYYVIFTTQGKDGQLRLE